MLDLTLGGLTFRFTGEDAYLSLLRALFEKRFPRFLASPLASTFAHVHVEPAQACKVIPQSIPRSFSWRRDRNLWGHSSDRLALTDGHSVALSEARAARMELYLHPATLEHDYFFSRTFLLIPILDILSTRGLHYSHGALVAKGAHATLLLGSGGAGKSTLSAELVRLGWAWISDDNLLIDEATAQGIAFEQELSLHPRVAAALNLEPYGTLSHGKIRIPHAKLPPSMLQESAHPTMIVDLNGVSEALEETPKSAVLKKCLDENPASWISKEAMIPALSAYKKLVQSAHCLSVSMPWQTAPRLAACLDAI